MRVGYYKWRAERVTGYLQRGGSLVMFIASMKILEMNLLWLIILPVAFVLLWYVDKFIFYPGESEAALRENPEWRRWTDTHNKEGV